MNRFRKSAEQGEAEAQYRLGLAYCLGHGVKKDYIESVKWLRRSADQGNAKAQYYLGFCYSIGRCLVKNVQTAYGWFLLSEAGGGESASAILANLETSLSPVQQQMARAWAKQWKPIGKTTV